MEIFEFSYFGTNGTNLEQVWNKQKLSKVPLSKTFIILEHLEQSIITY